MICTMGILFSSCKRDLVDTVLKTPAGVPGFTASASQVALSGANDSVTVVNFQWQAPNYGYSAAVTYSLLFDVPSDTSGASPWSNAIKVNIATDSLEKSYLGIDFNTLLNQMGLPIGSASTIVVRLESDVNQSTGATSTVSSIYASLAMTVTPYHVVLIYPNLYVAGDFLNPTWTPLDLPGWILASVLSNGSYEGYVNFPNASNLFKLCSMPNWNGINYGWGVSGTTISGSSTAGNCYFGGPGYCKIVADVNALTINYTTTSWILSGDFNSWSVTANPMTFSTATNQWTATGVSLAAGSGIKFVGDPGWNTFYGVDAKGNLSQNSQTSIVVPKTGVYTVTLDLSHGAGNYTYSIK